jgi:RNA polymerase sigma-70 factor (ECF subfamily)
MEQAALGAVIDRARGGEAAAFSELYRHLHPRVMGLCRHMMGTRAAAEDAASEVFLRLQRALADYDPTRPFPAYVLAIAKRHCIDKLRRQNLERRLFEAEADAPPIHDAVTPSPLDAVLQTERRDTVREALKKLTERQRQVLVLRYTCELSYDEIAEATGLGRNQVAVLIFRAKAALRQVLAPGRKEKP